jgi:hypothetical protein
MAKLYMPGEKVEKKSTTQDQSLSTWNPFRYAAKVPTYAYQALRSAPGMQNLQHGQDVLMQKLQEDKHPLYEQLMQQGGMPKIGVSPEEARQEAAQVLPNFMTQKLSLDPVAQALIGELPMAYATGGLSSLPAAGRYGLSMLGGYGGSALGGAIGGKPGELVGGIAGSLLPGHLPSRYFKGLPEQIGEELKQARAKVDESKLGVQKAEESLAAAREKAGLLKSDAAQKKLLAEQRKLKSIKLEHNQAVKAFESQHKYDKMIETKKAQQSKYYTSAEPLENRTPSDATKVVTDIRKLQPRLFEGLAAEDKTTIMNAMNDIEALAQENKLTTQQAKRTIKNLNEQVYADSAKRQGMYDRPIKESRAVADLVSEINKPLYEFIEENNSAKHNKLYNKGREITKEIHDDIRGRKEYLKKQEKQQKIKSLAAETEEAQYKTELAKKEAKQTALEQKHKDIIETHDTQLKEARESLKEHAKDLKDIEKNAGKKKTLWTNIAEHKGLTSAASSLFTGLLSAIGVPYAGTLAIGGLATGAGMGLYNEMKILKNAARNHPEQFAEFLKSIKDVTPSNINKTIVRLNSVAKDMKVPEKKQKKKRGLLLPS